MDGSPALQDRSNADFWRRGGLVADYDNVGLRLAEETICAQFGPALSGRVLDIGCGAGRLLGPLLDRGAAVYALDISADMVATCRRRHPAANVEVGNVADGVPEPWGRFTAILASDNVLDVFSDDQRRRVLADLANRLAAGGILAFSSHNLEAAPGHTTAPPARAARRLIALAGFLARRSPRELPTLAVRLAQRLVNRRRLRTAEVRTGEYAVINDRSHEFALLHYYIGREAQARQLATLGLDLLLCVDADGSVVMRDEPGQGDWLHYVATPAGAGAGRQR